MAARKIARLTKRTLFARSKRGSVVKLICEGESEGVIEGGAEGAGGVGGGEAGGMAGGKGGVGEEYRV